MISMIYTYSGAAIDAQEAFRDNISTRRVYDGASQTLYTHTHIFQKRMDGSMQFPFVRKSAASMSAYNLAAAEGWLLVINAAFDTNYVVENGINVGNGNPPTRPALSISNIGELGVINHDDVPDARVVPAGIVSAVHGWGPIIMDYDDYTEWDDKTELDPTEHAQRQIIGQYGNGDYAILTCEGRDYDNSVGWNYEEARRICKALGLKFAYNLDGGGSTQIVLGRKNLNIIYEGQTGRAVRNFIVFNGTANYAIPG